MKKPYLSIRKNGSEKTGNVIENFHSGIKSQDTKTTYTKTLREFLLAVEDFEGSFEQRAEMFARLAMKNPSVARSLLKGYAQYLKKRTEKSASDKDYLNPNTLPNKFKSIKKFLKMNEIPMEWSGIEAIFPEKNNVKQTRGYTTEEIKKILSRCTNPLSAFLILAESSSGIRVGAWEGFTWKNVMPIYKSKEGKYTRDESKAEGKIVCASIVVYSGTSSMYEGLISIEAWDKLQEVRAYWTEKMQRAPKPEDPIILTRYKDKRGYTKNGIRNKIFDIVKKSGIRTPLVEGQRTYDVPATHGFRKRWNKIMSEHQITSDSYGNLIRKERLFGHKVGVTALDKSYFHSVIEEYVSQYLEVMPDLMISEEYRMLRMVNETAKKNDELQEQLKQKELALVLIEELNAKVDRMERYEKINHI